MRLLGVMAALVVAACQQTSTLKPDEDLATSSSFDLAPDLTPEIDAAKAPAALSIAPTDPAFGVRLLPSETFDVTLTVTNTGASDSGPVSVALGGTDAAQFSIIGGSCGAMLTLAPSATCTSNVRFAPQSRGAKTATLTASATPGGSAIANLSGTAEMPATLEISPSPVPFGIVTAGMTASQTVTVRNTGDRASGALTTLMKTGADFSITGGSCSLAPLAAMSSCTADVQFAPAAFGDKSGTLTAGATPGGTATASLIGTGRQIFTLTVNKSGSSGSGTLASSPAGAIDCGSDCTEMITVTSSPAPVTLLATPSAGSRFGTWTGCATTSGNMCNLVIDASKTVTGTFIKTWMVTVNLSGIRNAQGSIGADQLPQLSCSPTQCTAAYDAGTDVTLTPSPAPGTLFQNWESPPCASRFGSTCSTGALAADFTVAARFRPAINLAFVTSGNGLVPGTIGADLLAADRHCDTLARTAGLYDTPVAGEPYFKALLSRAGPTPSPTLHAKDRLKRGDGSFARGWIRVDGREFADEVSELFSSNFSAPGAQQLFYPLSITEQGTTQANYAVTGSTQFGEAWDTCGDYTLTSASTVILGIPRAGSGEWIQGQINSACGAEWPIYCFETTFQTEVSPSPNPSARMAFVSSGTITGSSGRTPASTPTTADGICEAEKVSLPAPYNTGTYVSLLAVTGGSGAPSARFDLSGAKWVRRDYVELASTPTQLMSWNVLAPINVEADGGYVGANESVWTGSSAPNMAASSTASSCDNWSMTSSMTGSFGFISGSANFGFDNYATDCSMPKRVYCVQQ